MSAGFSILLFVIGAILHWAVTVQTSGINWDTVGVILMWAGGIGLVLSLLFFWPSGWYYRRRP